MKMQKSIIALLLCTFLTITFPCYANTEESEINEYILLNQGTPYDVAKNEENLKKKKQFLKEISELRASEISPMSSYMPAKIMGLPCFAQEKIYYCGPANVKQVIQFYNGTSASQATYASSMGTTSSGTVVANMVNELNKRQSKFTYCFEYVSNSSLPVNEFMDAVEDLTYVNMPMILHALPKYLPLYNGKGKGHYLTVEGYAYDSEGLNPIIYYVDTNTADHGLGSVLGKHSADVESVYRCITNRYLIY